MNEPNSYVIETHGLSKSFKTDFHRKERELEEVFLRIVEGGQHGDRE